jgi:hypothetical protein
MCAALSACASAPDRLAPYESDLVAVSDPDGSTRRDAIATDQGHADAGRCSAPASGCPCDVEGKRIECGTLRERFGDYVRCTPAYRSCAGGVWSDCAGDRIVGGR